MDLHGDCLKLMPKMATNSIDLIMTSPPYDKLRPYIAEGRTLTSGEFSL